VCAAPLPLHGQLSESRLLPDDGEEAEYFGWASAVAGEYAVIGASEDDDNGPASGSAYVFRLVGHNWIQHQKLLASDGSSYDTFGNAVAISDSFIVIGAQLDDDLGMDAGAVYVFRREGDVWSEHVKLTAGDGAPIDHFGSSVALAGSILVVGASLDDDNGENAGSAYVFHLVAGGWSEEAKLLADDGDIDDRFEEVAISDSTIIVGAWGDQDLGPLTGSAYIFVNHGTGWAQQAKLIAGDQAGGDQFGLDVAIAGDRAIVGAYANDDNGENSGSAYVFRREDNVWVQETKLLPGDGAEFDEFGISVSINESFALVGADVNDDNGENSGSAYIFRRNGTLWDQLTKINTSDGAAFDYFGISVGLDGTRAIIGAGGDDDNGADAGAAYIFEGFALPPGAPALLAPENGVVIGEETATLIWSPSLSGTDRYWLEWSSDSLFTVAIIDSNITDTTSEISGLQNSQTVWWRVRAHNLAGWGSFSEEWNFSVLLTGVGDPASRPVAFSLAQNYPNPFNAQTEFRFEIADYGLVELSIFDVLGRMVGIIVNETLAPGAHGRRWDAAGLPSGVYYYRLQTGDNVSTRKLVLVR
jgi:hypothetical protein